MNTISPEQLHSLHLRDSSIRLIDVRTPAEFAACHVPFAENCPLESLDVAALAQTTRGPTSDKLYVICQMGGRGANACLKLSAAGLSHVTNVDGGTAAWERAGLPVVRGRKSISLERQVRIAAGLLVLTGALLGFFVHPLWYGLAAIVGAGLTFAGITDTCGMGMVLARMPWNQVGSATNSSSASCKG